MRITNQTMIGNMLANLGALRSRTSQLENQISSGKRITKPSDDPSAGTDVMRLQSRLQMMDQWDKNIGDGKTWLDNTDATLGHMTDAIGRARDLALQASKGTLTNADRQSFFAETDQILDGLVAALNSQQDGDALFGGFATSGTPFAIDKTTGAVTYSGDSGDIRREVGPGVTLTVNVHGNRFGNWAAANNLLTTIWQLGQDMKSGTDTAIAANLSNIDANMQSTLNLRSEVGAATQRLEQADMYVKDMNVSLNQALENVQGTDMERAILELNNADTTYRAALQVGSRIIPQTLVDFLR